MNQASHLYRLQKLDTQIDKTITRLEEIQILLESKESIVRAEKTLETSANTVNKAQKKLKQIEEKAQSVKSKIEQSESTLYGGKVSNPKELQDIQNEIASLKKRLAAIEEEQLEVMIEVETLERHQRNSENELNITIADDTQEKSGLRGETDQLQKQLQKLSTEREAVLTSVSESNIQIYQKLRNTKQKIAVARIEDNTCMICGATMRPEEMQAARSSQSVAFCSSCGRILFAD